jgi:hypothetical protein
MATMQPVSMPASFGPNILGDDSSGTVASDPATRAVAGAMPPMSMPATVEPIPTDCADSIDCNRSHGGAAQPESRRFRFDRIR